MAVGDSRWTFLLQPNGRVDVLARVWRTADDAFVLDTDAGFGDELAARLARFKIRVKAELAPLAWRCIAVRGADVDGRRRRVVGPRPRPARRRCRRRRTASTRARRRPRAWPASRRRWPAMGAEIVPGETIPAETGVTRVAVDFRKGCYPGQELVERMDSRGATAPRSLRVVDGRRRRRSPAIRSTVDGDGVGALTSVAGTRRARPRQARRRRSEPGGDPSRPPGTESRPDRTGGDDPAQIGGQCRIASRSAATSGRRRTAASSGAWSMAAATFDGERAEVGGGAQPGDRGVLVAERGGGAGDRDGQHRAAAGGRRTRRRSGRPRRTRRPAAAAS